MGHAWCLKGFSFRSPSAPCLQCRCQILFHFLLLALAPKASCFDRFTAVDRHYSVRMGTRCVSLLSSGYTRSLSRAGCKLALSLSKCESVTVPPIQQAPVNYVELGLQTGQSVPQKLCSKLQLKRWKYGSTLNHLVGGKISSRYITNYIHTYIEYIIYNIYNIYNIIYI